MPFPSRFPGVCRRCERPIERGMLITWSRQEKGKAYHADCDNVWLSASDSKANNAASDHSETVQTSVTHTQSTTNADSTHTDAFGVFAGALAPYLEGMLNAKVDENKVRELIRETGFDAAKIESLVLDTLASVQPLTIRIEREDRSIKEITGAHERMPTLLYLVQKKHHVYLWGGPGSGKSTAAKQCADALGVRFGYISLNPQTPDSRLLGFIDANGTYRETVFFQLYRDGGVFCIDEMDNSSPSLLTTLNSCLENGHAAFPCGMVERHKDFVVVATGNTVGKGANPQFPDRRPFDAAFSERFSFLEWQYDVKLERAITLSINPNATDWLKWVSDTRSFCLKSYPRVLVSPRASFKGAEYLRESVLSIEDIAESVVFKGLESGTKQAILSACPLPKKAYSVNV